MIVRDFPHCCTAKIIADFGESIVAEGGDRPVTLEEVTDYLKEKIDRYANGIFSGYAVLVAITNSDQKTASKALRQLGFKHSTWMQKKQHPDTKIRLWWYPLMGGK